MTTSTRERPAWFRAGGECHDAKGVPIYPGDLLRTFHFRDNRRRKHYLYHVACFLWDEPTGHRYLRMVPAQYLDPSITNKGGDVLLSDDLAADCEVIAGYGPGDCLDYTDRPQRQLTEGE